MIRKPWFLDTNLAFNRTVNRNCCSKPVACIGRNTPVYTFSKLAKISIVLASGTLANLSYKKWVSCEKPSTRLTGYIVHDDKNLKFDWHKLWLYLRPHIWYIIAAIFVSFINCN